MFVCPGDKGTHGRVCDSPAQGFHTASPQQGPAVLQQHPQRWSVILGWCFCPALSGLVCLPLVAAKTFPPQLMPESGRERGRSHLSGKLKGKQLSVAAVPGCQQSGPGAPATVSLSPTGTVTHRQGGTGVCVALRRQELSGWDPRGQLCPGPVAVPQGGRLGSVSPSLQLFAHLGCPCPLGWMAQPEVDSSLGFSPALGYHKCFLLANHSPLLVKVPGPRG